MKNTLNKAERLKKRKLIKELFEKGSSFYLFPFKVIYLPASAFEISNHQLLVSVSKRSFKKATDRNKIKRRIREAYRLNKFKLSAYQPTLIGYIYTSREILPFSDIEAKLSKSLNSLSEAL